jgi:hypothetical protein
VLSSLRESWDLVFVVFLWVHLVDRKLDAGAVRRESLSQIHVKTGGGSTRHEEEDNDPNGCFRSR